ncbi:hypothetical protein M0812_21741 [Anaeramoeba flamelloides]|uniref:Uncharacterized protein n=1 Tax=Anaeramoeba flamelloides TaxID=1746091 RepID=A0AAV7YYH8_9EUKA|nr:hypothetical protein M0812_21741 [Anaeramoeba flamelloides]
MTDSILFPSFGFIDPNLVKNSQIRIDTNLSEHFYVSKSKKKPQTIQNSRSNILLREVLLKQKLFTKNTSIFQKPFNSKSGDLLRRSLTPKSNKKRKHKPKMTTSKTPSPMTFKKRKKNSLALLKELTNTEIERVKKQNYQQIRSKKKTKLPKFDRKRKTKTKTKKTTPPTNRRFSLN